MNKKRRVRCEIFEGRGEKKFSEKCFVKYLRSGEEAGKGIACSLGITVFVSKGGGRVVVASPRAHGA